MVGKTAAKIIQCFSSNAGAICFFFVRTANLRQCGPLTVQKISGLNAMIFCLEKYNQIALRQEKHHKLALVGVHEIIVIFRIIALR